MAYSGSGTTGSLGLAWGMLFSIEFEVDMRYCTTRDLNISTSSVFLTAGSAALQYTYITSHNSILEEGSMLKLFIY